MTTSPVARLPAAFRRGLDLARADDGNVGENDAPALKELANQLGRPDLKTMIDAMTTHTELPSRHNRLHGTGYAASVVSFTPGAGAGFNADRKEVVLGRPEGAGANAGSLHVLSLGHGGSITLKLGRPVSRGLVVFENPFRAGNTTTRDPGNVEVSADGVTWTKLKGQAGISPVFANSANRISPRTHAAGGDRFSFVDAGIPANTQIQFVRITDASSGAAVGTTAGFDLDAVYGF